MAMETIFNEAIKLTDLELELANKQYPLFVSMHEGHSVMLEEYDELSDQTKVLKKAMNMLWDYIKEHDEGAAFRMANTIETEAQKAAAEAIQVAAMAKKFRVSLERKGVE